MGWDVGGMWVGWDGMGWDVGGFRCLGIWILTKDATKDALNTTVLDICATNQATGPPRKQTMYDDFRNGSIHKTTWKNSGAWNYPTGKCPVQSGSQHSFNNKGSSSHPVET